MCGLIVMFYIKSIVMLTTSKLPLVLICNVTMTTVLRILLLLLLINTTTVLQFQIPNSNYDITNDFAKVYISVC
jgi:hypothetical protein